MGWYKNMVLVFQLKMFYCLIYVYMLLINLGYFGSTHEKENDILSQSFNCIRKEVER